MQESINRRFVRLFEKCQHRRNRITIENGYFVGSVSACRIPMRFYVNFIILYLEVRDSTIPRFCGLSRFSNVILGRSRDPCSILGRSHDSKVIRRGFHDPAGSEFVVVRPRGDLRQVPRPRDYTVWIP